MSQSGKSDPLATGPQLRKQIKSSTQHKDAYTRLNQDKSTYLTTHTLAYELHFWTRDHRPQTLEVWPMQVLRWCKTWFGELPKERAGGRARGYRIPLAYRYVGRAWLEVTDVQAREVIRRVLVEDPKPWVVVVGKYGSTHYTEGEVLERVRQLLPTKGTTIQIVNVGPME